MKYIVKEIHGGVLVQMSEFHDLAEAVECRADWEASFINQVSFTQWMHPRTANNIKFVIEKHVTVVTTGTRRKVG
jgi:hypothetical protein